MKIQDDFGFVSVTDCAIFVYIHRQIVQKYERWSQSNSSTGWQFLERLVLFNGSCQMKVIGWLFFSFCTLPESYSWTQDDFPWDPHIPGCSTLDWPQSCSVTVLSLDQGLVWRIVLVGFRGCLTQMSRGCCCASCLAGLGFVFSSCCYKLTFPHTWNSSIYFRSVNNTPIVF